LASFVEPQERKGSKKGRKKGLEKNREEGGERKVLHAESTAKAFRGPSPTPA